MAKEDELAVEDFRLSDISKVGSPAERLAFYEDVQLRLLSYMPVNQLELALYA